MIDDTLRALLQAIAEGDDGAVMVLAVPSCHNRPQACKLAAWTPLRKSPKKSEKSSGQRRITRRLSYSPKAN